MPDSQPGEGFKVNDRRPSSLSENEKSQREEEIINSAQASKLQVEEKPAEPQAIDFISFVFSLSTSALVQLGLIPDPQTNQTAKNIEQAKQTIDILGMMQEKTKGNLTDEEKQLMDNSLAELRLKYVSLSQQS